jgi:hypothetical protein
MAASVLAAGCGDDDGGGNAQAAPGDPPVTNAELGGQGEADDAETSAVEREEAAVNDAYQAAMDARIQSAEGPAPDQDLPALEDTHTDPKLEEWVSDLQGLINQGLAVRYPDGSELEILDTEVTFSWWVDDDGASAADVDTDEVGDKATVVACLLDDGETFDVETGEVTAGGGLYTISETATLRKIDGEWKLAELHEDRQWEGRDGCAAE